MAELTITLPALLHEPSPRGGIRFSARHDGNSFHAVLRNAPGRLVGVRDVRGVRVARSWRAVESDADLSEWLADALLWLATTRVLDTLKSSDYPPADYANAFPTHP